MKYDEEYNSFKFNQKEKELILNALSYAYWHNRSLSEPDRDSTDALYWLLHNAGRMSDAN